ncbi:18885_t:CDS:1, partial [Acaulospora morrowiae]
RDMTSTAVAAGVASYSGASSVVLGDFYIPVASSVLRFAVFPWSFSGISLRVLGVSLFRASCNMVAWRLFRDVSVRQSAASIMMEFLAAGIAAAHC